MTNLKGSLKKPKKKKATKKKPVREGLITRAAFARMLGITTATLQNHIEQGNMTLVDGMVDPEAAKKELVKNVDFSHGRTKMKIDGVESGGKTVDRNTLGKAKAYRESFKAKLAEIEYKEKIETLVNAEETKKAYFAIARKTRDQILNVPDRIMAQCAAESNPVEIRRLMMEELYTALESI